MYSELKFQFTSALDSDIPDTLQEGYVNMISHQECLDAHSDQEPWNSMTCAVGADDENAAVPTTCSVRAK